MMVDDTIRDFILRHSVGRLATTGRDGIPHVIPFCYALDAENIYFVVDQKPKRKTGKPLKRIRNMLENPVAAIVIDDYDNDWTRLAYVMITGGTSIVDSEDEYLRVLALLRERYPQYRDMQLTISQNSMVRIAVDKIHAWGKTGTDP